MPDLSTLSIFLGAVLLLLLSPGPNMAFVISHGAAYGWRGGVASGLGIGAADIGLTLLLSLIHISEPTRRRGISYAVFCLKKKKIARRQRQMCIRDSLRKSR